MNFAERRKQVFEKMERQSALILFSGIESHVSADEYAPFEADRNFFYLTGLRRDHMILLMKKTLKEEQVILFIEEADPTQERWYGRKVTVDEAKEISGIDNVMFLDSFEGAVDRMMAREDIDSLYFDCYRYQFEDMPDYNMIKAKEFAEKLNGRAYGDSFDDVKQEAKESGLVIVYGASDDLMEFDGAIYDEGGCFDGGRVYFDRNGVDQEGEERANWIDAVWCDGMNRDGLPATWTYETEIPCERFDIWEDGEIYCVGLVFSIEDLK